MADLNWDKWCAAWSAGMPKNPMWRGVRSGEHDPETGEPLYRYPDADDHTTTDPALADVLAAHRFVAPAVPADAVTEHCFCGWTGTDHSDHLVEKVEEFKNPPAKASAKKAAPKKAAE